jgi:hypothetical protein
MTNPNPTMNPNTTDKPVEELPPVLVDQLPSLNTEKMSTVPTLNDLVTEKAGWRNMFNLKMNLQSAKQALKNFGVLPKGNDSLKRYKVDPTLTPPPIIRSAIEEATLEPNPEAEKAKELYRAEEKRKLEVTEKIWSGLNISDIEKELAEKEPVLLREIYKRAEGPQTTGDSGYVDSLQAEVTILKTILDKKRSEEKLAAKTVTQPVEKLVGKLEKAEVKSPEATWSQMKMRTKVATDALAKHGVKYWEQYRNAPPALKTALSLTLMGASIATGGATWVASSSISTVNTASLLYERALKKATEKAQQEGTEINFNKNREIGKSLAIGAWLAFAAPEALKQSWTNLVPQEIKDVLFEKTHGAVSSLVDWFKDKAPTLGNNPIQVPPVDTSAIPDSMPASATPTQVPVPVVPEIPDAIKEKLAGELPTINVSEYTVQNGDALEKVLMNRGFEGGTITDQSEKLKHIYNLLSSDVGKAALAQSGIADPNNIKPGQVINMARFIELLNK